MSLVMLLIWLKTTAFEELDKEKNDKVGKSFSLLNASLPSQIGKLWREENGTGCSLH